jgi:transposase
MMTDSETLQKENALLKQQIEQKNAEIGHLQEQVRLLRLLHFGAKSEKLTSEDRKQGSLFNEAEDAAFEQTDEEQQEAVVETREVGPYTRKVKKKRPGRKPISPDLPREITEYDIPEEDKICACGSEKTCIGYDMSERAKIIPAKVIVVQERRKKYACKSCEGTEADEKGVQTAEGTKHIVPRSIADESLLAWSIHEKYEYALPLYRQSKRLQQIGIPIPRATLGNLIMKSAEACKPIYECLQDTIQSGPVINADETQVQVLKEPGREARNTSWMWVFVGGGAGKESVVFHYDPSRSHRVPYEFLAKYSGWLQTDDYEAYSTALKKIRTEREEKEGIQHVVCWAHVRRKFYHYWEISKSEDVKHILQLIRDLFQLEELRSDFSVKGFAKHRKNRAEPILEQLYTFLIRLASEVPPNLAFGKAIAYTLDNWEQLILYLENPLVTPSNNSAENAIRPFVIGRKNWMFSGTPRGAESSAILYSLVESAKLHKLSVYEYFHYILKKIPYVSRKTDFESFLPYNLTPDTIKI